MRLLPAAALAIAAFTAGIVVGAGHESAERVMAERFVAAWARADYGAMYELLSASSRDRIPTEDFRRQYRRAAETATLGRIERAGQLRREDGTFEVPLRAVTERFGALPGTLRFDVVTERDDVSGVVFEQRMVFPGLRQEETLSRTTAVPPRGELQGRDGGVLAAGPDRLSDVGPIAAEVVGLVGPIPPEAEAEYAAKGYPDDALIGLTGLERQFEDRLSGRLGGTLRAGERVLKTIAPQKAEPVRTSIDVELVTAAATGLAGRVGGVAVMRPGTGEVLALAGLGYSALQPPGSTLKIITLAAGLEAGVVKPGDTFPVVTSASLEGVELQNAHGELCGGTLKQAFAKSCNSVFAPMGVDVGPEKLVAMAERFGYNEADDIEGAPAASIPPAGEIGDDLAVGSSAIGQGIVTSTPLRMAEVAGVIANDGELVRPTLLRGGQGERSRAITEKTARIITRYMRAVVEEGTGTAAAVEGVKVAGKTGTAELRSTVPDDTDPETPVTDDGTDTDAWFVAFAPAKDPEIVVSVLLVGYGAGGETAAPAAKVVLDQYFD